MSYKKKLLALMSFISSFITGVVAMVLGSEINGLIDLYNKPIETVTLFASSSALGRIIGCSFAWKLVNKIGPVKTELLGNICIGLEVLLLPFIPFYYVGMLLAFLGGLGMALNDNSSPLIVAYCFPKTYSSMLSAGQTMYCFGDFSLSLLVTLFLKIKIPYFYANIICSLTIIISTTCAIICRNENVQSENREEKVKPIYSNNEKLAVLLVALGSFAYCAVCNCIGLFTTSYLESVDLSATESASLLTVYSIGSTIGSILFIYILRKMSERTALILNSCIGLISMLGAILVNTFTSYAIGLFFAGVFLGVMFALFLAIGTRVSYKDPASASSLVGTAGGLGDIIIPIIARIVLTTYGIKYAYYTSFIFLILTIIISIIIKVLTKEKENA